MSLHRPCHSLETLEDALQEVENIPAYLPNCLQLKDVVTKARKWLNEAEALQVKYTSKYPSLINGRWGQTEKVE